MSRAQFDGYLRQAVKGGDGVRLRGNGAKVITLDCGHKTTTTNCHAGGDSWFICSTCRDLGRKEAR